MRLETIQPTNQLTPRQLQLLKYIASFQQSQCCSPTIGQLATQLGLSRSTVFEHIGELRKKDHLTARPGKARSLRLTWRAQELLSNLSFDDSASYVETSSGIPIAGKVAAGMPIEAIENKEQLSLKGYFAGSDDTFALEVSGDSMIDDNILDGDYVICRRSKVANNGQLVIAKLDGDATLKRFYKEKNRVRLQPSNDNYAPIYSDRCQIEAIVVGLVRKM